MSTAFVACMAPLTPGGGFELGRVCCSSLVACAKSCSPGRRLCWHPVDISARRARRATRGLGRQHARSLVCRARSLFCREVEISLALGRREVETGELAVGGEVLS